MTRFLIAALLVLLPAAAMAASADETRLGGVINKMLASQKSAFEQNGGQFLMQGTPLVEAAGSYYAVTLPDIALTHPNKSQTALGIIALNASPAGPQSWNMTIALPTPIITKNASGQVESELALGKQHFTGMWSEALNNFTSMKATYDSSVFTLKDGAAYRPFSAANIGKMQYGFDLASPAQEKSDLFLRMGLNDVSVIGAEPAYAKLVPQESTVNIDVKEFPVKELSKLDKGISSPDQLLSLLTKAGSDIVINTVSMKNATSSALLTGRLKPAANTPLGYAGTAVLDITGLEPLLLSLNDAAAKMPPLEQGKVQGIRVALTLMAALGQDSGTGAKRYNVELTPDGKVMMNGTDFSAMLGVTAKTAKKIKGR